MKYYSTNHSIDAVDLRTAVLQGLPKDKGLYMPDDIPLIMPRFFENIQLLSFREIATSVALTLLGEDLPSNVIIDIIDNAITFDTPLIKLDDTHYVLELFHGPTLAFKDVGARFMARLMKHYIKDTDQKLTVLVATSGDTGSAVANGFLGIDGIDVIILYPSGKVSKIQEQQLTTMGENITAIEVDGSFDDCQNLVKTAFVDKALGQKMTLTSANSINIARLIPQTFYYFHAYAQLKRQGNTEPSVISIPSGNAGNLTAALIAKRMGLPVKRFIAACNSNDSLAKYLHTGELVAKPTKHTISNAMDVGNPSNLMRIQDLYSYSVEFLRQDLLSWSFDDDATRATIRDIYKTYNYIMDPHGAVGYLGTKRYEEEIDRDSVHIILETAHPAKFKDTVDAALGITVDIPSRLEQVLHKSKQSLRMPADFEAFKQYLLS
ncbi:MAG: threonine synthase [Candidatus Marinimicrobia bacterium]|nr:threonine synthase [Candidatus Neomarinimicrobiota bacterium]